MMPTAFRRTAGRLAVAALATAALAGAAIAGGQAADASTSCDTPVIKTLNALLTLREGPTPHTQTCR